ncbi:uncharacterized protein LOC126748902 [Anthonomus grandis grandis]|uniref:uncharacterized protein LOC126748902 n=1 Tax=Anthonomus grandis grandis TaxID=2921223 RepID=UPI002165540E|nr:uncharacterized protein LOC126748902 [Anthonomus grandis grandis]
MLQHYHILYNNCVYYQVPTQDLLQIVKTQCKINTYSDYEPSSREAFVYYKLDCIFFELHRRRFISCLIQLSAFHKVNSWLQNVTPQIRCDCCRPDYYEYMLDCERVLRRQLVLTGMHREIVETRALSGGRCFFMKTRLSPEYEATATEVDDVTYKDAVDEISNKTDSLKLDKEDPEYETPDLYLKDDSTSSGAYAPAIPPRDAAERKPFKRHGRFRNLRDSIILATYRGVALGLGPFPHAKHAILRRMRERENKQKGIETEAENAYEVVDDTPPHPEDALEKAIREKRFWTVNIMKERAEAEAARKEAEEMEKEKQNEEEEEEEEEE